ncbi:MAG TPA: EVE domain-containing protein [Herpetosiphonaceae bacterium]|nr:EVE domain-containing protein [Herpetosiphonaceae bacterium]
MAYWILKTEPDDYSWDDLNRAGRTVWDGVANNTALMHIRTMQIDDEAMIYHTGDVRAAVGIARVASAPYADPAAGDPKLVVVDVEPVRALARAVPLARIKAEPALAEWALVRQGRLSVVPCTAEQWRWLLEQGEG